MKKIVLSTLFLGLNILCFPTVNAAAYAVEDESPSYIMVEQEPPADIAEVVTVSPGKESVWVKGHWAWNKKWYWVKGHWAYRPHKEAVWVEGHWKKKHHHWVWVKGYWE